MYLVSLTLDHAQFLHEVPDDYLADLLPIAKKIALAVGADNYNVLQNNGKLARTLVQLTTDQEVPHVHFHVMYVDLTNNSPKTQGTGLGISWNTMSPSQDELKGIAEDIRMKVMY